jgi:hypothetical protein
VRQSARIILRFGLDLRKSDVAGGVDELSELAVGHRSTVNPKTIDPDMMGWCLFGIMTV